MHKQLPADVFKKRRSLKFHKTHRKTPVLEPLFNTVKTLVKRDSNTGVFLRILRNGGLTRSNLHGTICMTLIRFYYDLINLNV